MGLPPLTKLTFSATRLKLGVLVTSQESSCFLGQKVMIHEYTRMNTHEKIREIRAHSWIYPFWFWPGQVRKFTNAKGA